MNEFTCSNEGLRLGGWGGTLLNQPLTISSNGMVERFSREFLRRTDKQVWLVISFCSRRRITQMATLNRW
jgi:hypothetical protein